MGARQFPRETQAQSLAGLFGGMLSAKKTGEEPWDVRMGNGRAGIGDAHPPLAAALADIDMRWPGGGKLVEAVDPNLFMRKP
jgi:hypothetical protein